MASLFSSHPLVLQTAYSELKRQAFEQAFLLAGTPGSVGERVVHGRPFLYRQFYDVEGRKRAEYIGAVGDPDAERKATEIRAQIELENALLSQARMLARQGYVRADAKTGAVLSALANHGLFRAGALIVGSHAYGVLLNELGVRSAAFHTADVDVVRGERLELASGSPPFQQILAASTLSLSPVVGFDRKVPPTSYKSPGRDGLRVDLLVPTSGGEVTIRSVPELDAHATALPHLRYLIDEPLDGVLLGREAVVPVRVPRPERFAWHKMLVSQLRAATSDKSKKDLHQAAALFAALAESEPDALGEAFAAVPAKSKTKAGARRVLELLEGTPHTRGAALLREIVL